MTQKSRAALITQAQTIRDETSAGANTATRVGTMDEDTNDSAFNILTDDTDNITESATKEFLNNSAEQIIAGNKEFSGQAYASNAAATTKTFTATPTFDFNSGNDQQMTLTGNVTTFATSNSVGSASYKVYLINDASVRTVAAPTGWTADASSETHTTVANAVNLYQFYTFPDGTKYFNLHIVKA